MNRNGFNWNSVVLFITTTQCYCFWTFFPKNEFHPQLFPIFLPATRAQIFNYSSFYRRKVFRHRLRKRIIYMVYFTFLVKTKLCEKLMTACKIHNYIKICKFIRSLWPPYFNVLIWRRENLEYSLIALCTECVGCQYD